MSLAETLMILIVAFVVFGPDKLPELAKHLGKLFAKGRHLKAQMAQQLHKQQLQFNLEENLEKAAKADEKYKKDPSA